MFSRSRTEQEKLSAFKSRVLDPRSRMMEDSSRGS